MRYMRVKFYTPFLMELLIQDKIIHAQVIKGLPIGTKFCYFLSSQYYTLELVVTHESFPELKDGDEIPLFNGNGIVVLMDKLDSAI